MEFPIITCRQMEGEEEFFYSKLDYLFLYGGVGFFSYCFCCSKLQNEFICMILYKL